MRGSTTKSKPTLQVRIGGEPAPKGQQFTYSVRAPGDLALIRKNLRNVIIQQNPDGLAVAADRPDDLCQRLTYQHRSGDRNPRYHQVTASVPMRWVCKNWLKGCIVGESW